MEAKEKLPLLPMLQEVIFKDLLKTEQFRNEYLELPFKKRQKNKSLEITALDSFIKKLPGNMLLVSLLPEGLLVCYQCLSNSISVCWHESPVYKHGSTAVLGMTNRHPNCVLIRRNLNVPN